jgi:sulfoacetaldehyde acetyltransferase
VEYAKVAEACGIKGVKAETAEGLTNALKTAVDEQMNKNVTTFIEVVLNQELGEPFRRDAMKAPVAVAGINPKDMRPQEVA